MKQETQKKISFAIIAIVWILLFVRLFYGFDQTDESFYYAVAKRLCQGDIPFVDEWYPAQLSAILLCPFYYAYTFFVPSGDGIILAGRICYWVIQVIVSLFILDVYKNRKFQVMAALIYLLCSRQNIQGLSYYNLYMTSCVLMVAAFFSYFVEKRRNVAYLVIGAISICVATLCMPYFAILAIAFVIVLLIQHHYKEMIVLVLGILACATIYIVFLLSRASLFDYITGVGHVLSNPDYANISLGNKLSGTILSIGKVCIIGTPCVIYMLIRLFSMKRITPEGGVVSFQRKDHFVFIISAFLCVMAFGFTTPGAVFLQFSFLAFPYVVKSYCNNKMSVGVVFYILGVLFSLAFWLGSDTEASCLTLGLVISILGVLVVLEEEVLRDYKSAIALLFLVVIAGISARILGPCYRDAFIWELDTRLNAGPAQGLITEQSDADDYNRVVDMLDELERAYSGNEEDIKVLYSRFLPWAYLVTDFRNASMTPWRSSISDPWLMEYYKINPDNFPNLVVVFDKDIGENNGISGGEKMNENNPLEGELWDLLSSKEINKMDAGIVIR